VNTVLMVIGHVFANEPSQVSGQRLREKAAPKSINEEVGFLLRLLSERGELIRARLRKQKALELKVPSRSPRHIRQRKNKNWSKRRARRARRQFTRPLC
jgi:hypothetical protein